jgi:hypothetical protein
MAGISEFLGSPAPVGYCGEGATRVQLFAFSVAIGGTGAVGTITNGPGGVTVTRASAGTYSIAFPSCRYINLFSARHQPPDGTGTNRSELKELTVDGPTGVVTVIAVDSADLEGAAADPVTGSVLHFAGIVDYT